QDQPRTRERLSLGAFATLGGFVLLSRNEAALFIYSHGRAEKRSEALYRDSKLEGAARLHGRREVRSGHPAARDRSEIDPGGPRPDQRCLRAGGERRGLALQRAHRGVRV